MSRKIVHQLWMQCILIWRHKRFACNSYFLQLPLATSVKQWDVLQIWQMIFSPWGAAIDPTSVWQFCHKAIFHVGSKQLYTSVILRSIIYKYYFMFNYKQVLFYCQLYTSAIYRSIIYKCYFMVNYMQVSFNGQLYTSVILWSIIYKCYLTVNFIQVLINGQLYTSDI